MVIDRESASTYPQTIEIMGARVAKDLEGEKL